jgi:hypothetical protein
VLGPVLEVDHGRLISGRPDWDVAAVVERMGAGAAEFAEGRPYGAYATSLPKNR